MVVAEAVGKKAGEGARAMGLIRREKQSNLISNLVKLIN